MSRAREAPLPAKPRTNYARISADYDADRDEYISFDHQLAEVLLEALERSSAAGCPARLLDVGCGTGTVLGRIEAQLEESWIWSLFGVDACEAMLQVARGKVFNAGFAVGPAEALPFRGGSVGCLISTFAFHHFQSLDAFLDEAWRVLAPGGSLVLRNILPRDGAEPLMYHFFDGAREVDQRRFPLLAEVLEALARHGLALERHVRLENEHRFSPERYTELCRKRTISQLDLILDQSFRRGLAAIAEFGREHPGEPLIERIPVHTFLARR